MKVNINIEMDYHEATPALTRLLELLDWAGTGYGINSMNVSVDK